MEIGFSVGKTRAETKLSTMQINLESVTKLENSFAMVLDVPSVLIKSFRWCAGKTRLFFWEFVA